MEAINQGIAEILCFQFNNSRTALLSPVFLLKNMQSFAINIRGY